MLEFQIGIGPHPGTTVSEALSFVLNEEPIEPLEISGIHGTSLGLHRLAITEFPNVRSLASALACYDGEGELNRGLDLLLPGLESALTTVEAVEE